MDGPFIYSKYVTGKHNYGRKTETGILGNLIWQGENIVIYDAPKTGKTSLIQQSLIDMKTMGRDIIAVSINLMDVRSISEFALRLGSEVLRAAFSSPSEYREAAASLLPGSHLVFDETLFTNTGTILSLNWDLDDNDISAILSLPYKIGEQKGRRILVVLDEFQSVMNTEDGDKICRLIEARFRTLEPSQKTCASYLFCGSKINAMHEIFGIKRYFYRNIERVQLAQIETKDIIDNVSRGFLATGKVVDRDLMLGVCKLFRNHIGYINHFAAICDSLTRGYIMEPILNSALEAMLAIHEARFRAAMDDLTTFQVSLLRAILDGHTKFTGADIIERYRFNSSANVRRLKDALSKKEIVFFEDDGSVTIIDPLFEYWVRTFYFKIGI